MDDNNAFERQLAAEIDAEVGPPHPVDALAITRTAKTPTPKWRIHTMFSPVKAIVTGALVFATGGALLIAQSFDPDSSHTPGADGDTVSMDTAWVTGTLLHAAGCTMPERTTDDGIVHERGYRCESQIWETDDPRLNGRATPSWNADVYRLGPDVSVLNGIWEVVTDDGGWLCSSGPNVVQGAGLVASTNPETLVCAGETAYAGLSAVLDVDVDAGSVQGLVFAGEAPAAPEPTDH